VLASKGGISDNLNQIFQTVTGHRVEDVIDGGQGRIEKRRLGDIVETDQGDLSRHMKACLVQGSQDSEGQLIIGGDDGRKKYRSFPSNAYLLGVYEARNSAVFRPVTPGYLQLEDIFFSTFEDVRNGVDPKQALDGAAERVDRFLAQFK
jgi:hypothetical protein